MEKEKEKENKRQSIRIKDRLLLSFKKITKEEYDAKVKNYIDGIEDPWIDTCHPGFQKEIKGYLKNLREKDKDLAAILEIFDQKLNLILGLIGTEETFEQDGLPKKLYKVDLSAQGLGFFTTKSFERGDILSLTIGLLPEHYFFSCFGKVVRTKKKDNKTFVGLKFIWITEDDKEKLIEHIFARQVIHLRMRRQGRHKE